MYYVTNLLKEVNLIKTIITLFQNGFIKRQRNFRKDLNKQKQEVEELYQQKIKSIENQLLENIRNLEKDLQNEKYDRAKVKEILNILEVIFNKSKKEVITEIDLNLDKKLYEKLKTQNIKVKELNEANQNLKKKVSELEKILESYIVTTLSITEYDKDNILEPLLKYQNLTTLNWKNTQLTSLPNLPNPLNILNCNHTQITSLPNIPNSLTILDCSHTQLTSLNNLPNTLTTLYCNNTKLTSLPNLPNSLTTLHCYNEKNHDKGSNIGIKQLVFQDVGNSKIRNLTINILGTGSNELYIKRGLSNGNHNSGIYVIKPEVHDINDTITSNKTIYELNQEEYIIFQ